MDSEIIPFSRASYEKVKPISRDHVLDVLYRAIEDNVIDPQDLLSAHAAMVNRAYYPPVPPPYQRCVSISPPPSLEPEPLQNLPIQSLNPTRRKNNRKRYKGFVKCFGPREGYGFITCNELKSLYHQDVFLHHVQVSELGFSLTRGDLVEFTVEENANNQPQARNLKRLRAAR